MRNFAGLAAACWPALLACGAPGWAAEAAKDPRPVVLLYGDRNLEAMDYSESPGHALQLKHPEWKVATKSYPECTVGKLIEELPNALAEQETVSGVFILTGVYEVFNANYERADAAACGAQMTVLLAKLKEHPKTAKALLAVITPLGISDARLEQAVKTRMSDGEARSKAVAEAYRKAAQGAAAPVIDLHAWSLETKDPTGKDTRPAWVLGSKGWFVREWGLPHLTDFLVGEAGKLKIPAQDAAAFEIFMKELEADRKLDVLLAQTSEGAVACGPALSTKGGAGMLVLEVPAAELTGAALDLLITSDSPSLHGYQAGTTARNSKVPELSVELEGGTKAAIKPHGWDWQVMDEAQPEKPVGADVWRWNASYTDHFVPAVCGKPGERKHCLLRFPLQSLAGARVVSAVVSIAAAPVGKAEGKATVFPIRGPDKQWHCSKAAWKTRDGEFGWTGGKVDAAKRKQLLEEFLKSQPPEKAAARAKELLAGL